MLKREILWRQIAGVEVARQARASIEERHHRSALESDPAPDLRVEREQLGDLAEHDSMFVFVDRDVRLSRRAAYAGSQVGRVLALAARHFIPRAIRARSCGRLIRQV